MTERESTDCIRFSPGSERRSLAAFDGVEVGDSGGDQ